MCFKRESLSLFFHIRYRLSSKADFKALCGLVVMQVSASSMPNPLKALVETGR